MRNNSTLLNSSRACIGLFSSSRLW